MTSLFRYAIIEAQQREERMIEMTERQMERVAIIEQIIGNIESCGETNSDKRALQNLELAEEVIIRLIESLVRNSEDNSYEFSVQKIKERSIRSLKYIQEITENI